MPMTPREMIKHLKKNGFEEISQNGSHVKLKNQTTGITVIACIINPSFNQKLPEP